MSLSTYRSAPPRQKELSHMVRGTEIVLLLMVLAAAVLVGAALSISPPEAQSASPLSIDHLIPVRLGTRKSIHCSWC
jgi:hypothetical protein